MKKLITILLIPGVIFGIQSFKFTPDGSSVIPTFYHGSLGYLSMVRTEHGSVIKAQGYRTVCIYNGHSTARISFTSAPHSTNPDGNGENIYIPPSVGRCQDVYMSGGLYIRSDSGSDLTSGTITGDINEIK